MGTTCCIKLLTFFILWCYATSSTHGRNFSFINEPLSAIVQSDDNVILHCDTNTPAESISWYFNEVIIVSKSETVTSNHDRSKRNKDDRNRQSGDLTDHQYHKARENNRHKKRRRKTDGNTKKKSRREKSGHHRYVRSAEEETGAKILGVSIGDARLEIKHLNSNNAGMYYCVASTSEGTIRSKTAFVQMAQISDFPPSPSNTIEATSDAVVIPCTAKPESSPPANIKWEINDEPLHDIKKNEFMTLASGDLLVKNTTSFSGSQFRCLAENPVTRDVKKSLGTSALRIGRFQGEARLIYPQPGSTINVTAKAGESLLMECISGDLSKLIWTRDNGNIPDSARITDVGLNMTLKKGDSGSYFCKTKDSSMRSQYNLIIRDELQCQPSTSTNFTRTGDIISMGCSSNIPNLTWKWYTNGKLISSENGPSINVSSDDQVGFYQCSTSIGTESCSVTFTVESTEDAGKDLNIEYTTSEEYFQLKLDKEKVPSPEIDISDSPTSSSSCTIQWTIEESAVKLISIRYFKEPLIDGDQVTRYSHKIVNVPAELGSVSIKNLDPSSDYSVEAIAVSDEDTRSDVTMSSFRTGGQPSEPHSNSPSKPHKEHTDVGIPQPPYKLNVNRISVHEVSLMWTSRGNGGSPILGFKVQMKEVGGKERWKLKTKTNSPPCNIDGLQRGKTYKFRVIAYNAEGDSRPSQSSKPYPRTVKVLKLEKPPKLLKLTPTGSTVISVDWEYDIPQSQIGGYNIYYRPTDMDNEEDYKTFKYNYKINGLLSYSIQGLSPGTQYDVKIKAFNTLGESPSSHVLIAELPKSDEESVEMENGHNPNTQVKDKFRQRDMIYLVSGCVVAAILLVLLFTAFCYWRKRAKKDESVQNLSQRNGNTNGYVGGKQRDHMTMTKLNSNGQASPNESGSGHHSYNHSPHDTRCRCSRHHSNQSSLGREGNRYQHYPLTQGGFHQWGPGNYPNISTGPVHVIMDPRNPYFQAHGIGRWVRGGDFCHIVPVDTRKMSNDGGTELESQLITPRGLMVTRTYDGNLTTTSDSVSRPDHGYHSNDEGIRTGSDSQPEKSDDTTQSDDDANSAGAATSGVVTLNDATIDSRPSSPSNEDEETSAEMATSSTNVSKSETSEFDELSNNTDNSEVTPFLSNNIDNAEPHS